MKRKSKPEPESESESESSSFGSSSEEEEEEVEEKGEEGDGSESESEESESEDEGSKKPPLRKKHRLSKGEEEAIDPADRDAIRQLVEPFSKEQLMALLTEAAMVNPSVMSAISSSAQSDSEHRKIFVHGLNFDATTEDLRQAFVPFGTIEEVKAVCDRVTGRCKGYGFVLFEHRSSAQNALKEPQRCIGERTVQCQLASRGPTLKPKAGAATSITRASVDIGPNFALLGGLNSMAGLGLLNQAGVSPSLASGGPPTNGTMRQNGTGTGTGNAQY